MSESELVSVWLDESSISDGSAELVSRKGEVVGEVTFSDDGAAGEVEVEGESHPFSAEPASAEAGIARQVEGEPGEPGFEELGWVVLNDGSFRGAKTATTQSGTSSFMDTNTLKKPTTGYIDPVHNL